MAHYRDNDGTLYWFDQAPDPALVRADLVEVADDGSVAVIVPQSVTMRQARLAMLVAGILHLVDDAIAGMPSPAKEAAQINWEYASEVQRNDTMVGALAASLGMTDQDVDALFIAASGL